MSRPRILLVDDDRRVRQLVGLTLPADDYELSFAEDGADAIRSAHRLNPDLILLDYQMPGIHGVDVCAAIRSDPATAETPIIMLTGHNDEEIRDRAVSAGANGFLTKPFSPLTLEQTIRALLGVSGLPALAGADIHRGHAPSPFAAPARPSPRPPSAPAARRVSEEGVSYAASAASAASAAPVAVSPASSIGVERSLESVQRRYAALHDTYLSTIEALATALELRGAEIEGHAQRVSLYTIAAARRLSVPTEELEQIRWGAILHDVGMIAVPDAILLKPGQLHPGEWSLVRMHPEHGARLLQNVPGLGSALAIVRYHHERFDGAGYPLGLRGTAIPLPARIFAVADALDAITTDRPYRPTRTWEQARMEILQGRGSHFDPSVVDAFLEIFDDLQGLTGAEQPLAPPA
jgi:response regulator RpfG family c-di-GMP phosphodiesterase